MKTYTKEDIGDEQLATLKVMTGKMLIEDLAVGVQIKDVRRRFGHIDVLVQPLNGTGEQWVEKHRIKVAK